MPLVAFGDELAVDVLDGADVQAARGLDGDDERLFAVQLAGHDGLLLVAAGHAAHDRDGPLAGAHVVLLDQPLGVFAHVAGVDEAGVLELFFLIALQHQVLLQREVEYQAVLVPVLGDVAHVRAALFDAGVGDVVPAELDMPVRGLLQPGEAVDELRLAVAVDAGDAEYLARAHVEADAVHGVLLVDARGDGEVPHAEHGLLRLGGVLDDFQLHGAADHHVGERLLVGVLGLHRADAAALAQDGHAVGHRHDLVELVGDEEDALALAREAAHDLHQLVDLLRREHGRGLVEDEDVVVAVEHLQYLHALLHADGDVLDLGVEVNVQAVALGELFHLFAGLPALQEAHFRRLRAEDDVVEHGKDVDELEMLVHHADAERRGVVGVVDLHDLPVLADLPGLGLVKAEEDAHKRALARAVFAQKGVYLAFPQPEGDVVVGDDARELLGDVEHFNDIFWLCCHRPAPSFTLNSPIIRYRRRKYKEFVNK